jgi:hypothetical protein
MIKVSSIYDQRSTTLFAGPPLEHIITKKRLEYEKKHDWNTGS